MSEPAEQFKNDEAKSALLTSARAVMARDGAKFSIRSVCEHAGIDRDDFNQHFDSRIALMAALVGASEPVFQQSVPTQIALLAPPLPVPVWPADSLVAMPGSLIPAAPPNNDAWLERRLRVFERALTALETKAEETSREQARTIELLEKRLNAAQSTPVPPIALAAAPAEEAEPAPEMRQAEAPAPPRDLRDSELPAPPAVELTEEEEEQLPQSSHDAPPEPAHAMPDPDTQDVSPEDSSSVPEIEVAPETGMVLLLPEAPRPETNSREEMAEVLASARQAARNAAEEESSPGTGSTKRLHLLAACVLGLVAAFVGIGLTIGGNARATQTIEAGAGVVHRQLAGNSFSRLAARADSGDVNAQARLAFAYLRGDGAPGNAAAALRWASEAAAHGDPMAEYLLGTFYQPGQNRGVKPDAAHAFQLFSAAAAQGNIKAMHNLAIAYAEGLGTAKDEVQAAQWFERAASHGYVDSAFDLAVLYERGLGVRQSLKDALRWYSIAAIAGDHPSADRAAFLRHQVSPEDAVVASNAAASFSPLAPISGANRL